MPATRRTSSYRARLTGGYVIVVALFASAWAWSLFGPLTAAVIVQQEDHLISVARAGSLVLAETDLPPSDVVDRLVGSTRVRLTVVRSDGTVVADSEAVASDMENHGQRPEVRAALEGRTGTDRRLSETQGTEQLYVAVPAMLDGSPAVLRASSSLESVNAVAASARRWGLVLLGTALVIASVIVGRLTAAASEPVRRLSDAAEAMAAGNLSTRVPAESGELGALSIALADLRDQMKRRLDALESEQSAQRSVLDGLTDAVLLLDGTDIRFANEATSALFRPPVGGWRGRAIDSVQMPASVVGVILAHLRSNTPVAEECGPDPLGRYLRVTMLPIGESKDSPKAVVTISDVTDRTRVDEVRRDFVSGASHELKTPVAGIQLLAASAADAADAGDMETAVAFARQIDGEATRLGRLVGDLLDLSRLESAPSPGAVTDVRQAIANAVLGHSYAAEKRGLDISVDESMAAGMDAYASADPTDVAIALDNLLDNAISYTESGAVRIELAVGDEHVTVAVSDSGIGIPAEDLPRIFERFYRVDRARSRDSGGTGLGLALVRHMIERSNGSVEVSSILGRGSVFTITLPRVVSPRRARPRA